MAHCQLLLSPLRHAGSYLTRRNGLPSVLTFGMGVHYVFVGSNLWWHNACPTRKQKLSSEYALRMQRKPLARKPKRRVRSPGLR